MNYLTVLSHIEQIKRQAGRTDTIQLVAVTKNRSQEDLELLYAQGCRLMGENRLQESLSKIEKLPQDIDWHFIGTLQKNKVAKVVSHFKMIESVDHLELASKIGASTMRPMPILIQVNTSGELSKHGLSPEEWKCCFESLLSIKGIALKGMMTMAPFTNELKIVRQTFARLRLFRDEMQKRFSLPALELSMGMSHDYPIAIEEGATILRIGSALYS